MMKNREDRGLHPHNKAMQSAFNHQLGGIDAAVPTACAVTATLKTEDIGPTDYLRCFPYENR
jgi:hypothetical protein